MELLKLMGLLVLLTLNVLSASHSSVQHSTPPNIYPYITEITTLGPDIVASSGVKRSLEQYEDPFTEAPISAGAAEQSQILRRYPTASSDATKKQSKDGVTPLIFRPNSSSSEDSETNGLLQTASPLESHDITNQSDAANRGVTQPALSETPSTFSGNPHHIFKSNQTDSPSSDHVTRTQVPSLITPKAANREISESSAETMVTDHLEFTTMEPILDHEYDTSSSVDDSSVEGIKSTGSQVYGITEGSLEHSADFIKSSIPDEDNAGEHFSSQTSVPESFTPTDDMHTPDTPDIQNVFTEDLSDSIKQTVRDFDVYEETSQRPLGDPVTANERNEETSKQNEHVAYGDFHTTDPSGQTLSLNGKTVDTNGHTTDVTDSNTRDTTFEEEQTAQEAFASSFRDSPSDGANEPPNNPESHRSAASFTKEGSAPSLNTESYKQESDGNGQAVVKDGTIQSDAKRTVENEPSTEVISTVTRSPPYTKDQSMSSRSQITLRDLITFPPLTLGNSVTQSDIPAKESKTYHAGDAEEEMLSELSESGAKSEVTPGTILTEKTAGFVATKFPPFETDTRDIKNATNEWVFMLGDQAPDHLSKSSETMQESPSKQDANTKKEENDNELMELGGSGDVDRDLGKTFVPVITENHGTNSQNNSDAAFETSDSSGLVDREYLFPNGINHEKSTFDLGARFTYILDESTTPSADLLQSQSVTFSQEAINTNDMQTTSTSLTVSSTADRLDNNQLETTMAVPNDDYIHDTVDVTPTQTLPEASSMRELVVDTTRETPLSYSDNNAETISPSYTLPDFVWSSSSNDNEIGIANGVASSSIRTPPISSAYVQNAVTVTAETQSPHTSAITQEISEYVGFLIDPSTALPVASQTQSIKSTTPLHEENEDEDIIGSSTFESFHDVTKVTEPLPNVIVTTVTSSTPHLKVTSISVEEVTPTSLGISATPTIVDVEPTQVIPAASPKLNNSLDKKLDSPGDDNESKELNNTVTIPPRWRVTTNQDSIPLLVISISIGVAVIALIAIVLTCICYNNSDSLRRMKYSFGSRSGTYNVADEIALGTPGRLDYMGDHAYKNYRIV